MAHALTLSRGLFVWVLILLPSRRLFSLSMYILQGYFIWLVLLTLSRDGMPGLHPSAINEVVYLAVATHTIQGVVYLPYTTYTVA